MHLGRLEETELQIADVEGQAYNGEAYAWRRTVMTAGRAATLRLLAWF